VQQICVDGDGLNQWLVLTGESGLLLLLLSPLVRFPHQFHNEWFHPRRRIEKWPRSTCSVQNLHSSISQQQLMSVAHSSLQFPRSGIPFDASITKRPYHIPYCSASPGNRVQLVHPSIFHLLSGLSHLVPGAIQFINSTSPSSQF
jgi:hypothetical protein